MKSFLNREEAEWLIINMIKFGVFSKKNGVGCGWKGSISFKVSSKFSIPNLLKGFKRKMKICGLVLVEERRAKFPQGNHFQPIWAICDSTTHKYMTRKWQKNWSRTRSVYGPTTILERRSWPLVISPQNLRGVGNWLKILKLKFTYFEKLFEDLCVEKVEFWGLTTKLFKIIFIAQLSLLKVVL